MVGHKLYPGYAANGGGFFFLVFGVIALLGGLVQINPIWLYGPYQPDVVSAGSQPDWYIGWLDGALRLMPGWEFSALGYTFSLNLFLPSVVIPGIIFTGLALYPFIEARFTGDNGLPQPARPAAGQPAPDGPRRDGDHLLRDPLDHRWQRHRGDDLQRLDQRDHLHRSGPGDRGAATRVLDHLPAVPEPAGEGPRRLRPRRRDRPDQAAPLRRGHRGARARSSFPEGSPALAGPATTRPRRSRLPTTSTATTTSAACSRPPVVR